MKLWKSSWKQAEEYFTRKDLVVLPVGSLENHGSQLALGTDALVPQNLVERMDDMIDAAFAPVMPFGVADSHIDFPGTVTIGHDGLKMVMSRVTDGLYRHGARRFVFLNGHGGNDAALSEVGLELRSRGAMAAILDWWVIAGELDPAWKGGHGAGMETAAMMAIDPECVHMELFEDEPARSIDPELHYFKSSIVETNGVHIAIPRPVREFAPAGWFGDDYPLKADAGWGEKMLQTTAEFCADFICRFEKLPL